MAEQSFAIAVCFDSSHSEALNNTGVLLRENGKDSSSRLHFQKANTTNKEVFEPWYNKAVDAIENEDLQSAFESLNRALDICPDHAESKKLLDKLLTAFASN